MTWSEFLAAQLDRARKMAMHFIADFEDEEFFVKSDNVNPGIWVLGHMANSETAIVFATLGEPIPRPDNWQELFGIKAKLLEDLHQYPPLSEVRRVFDEGHQKTLERIRRLSDKDLLAPAHPDMQVFDWLKTVRDGLYFAMLHEANHGGQLMWLRKLLGKSGLI